MASGLRRPLGCVWPGPGQDEHAGRLVLWVGDQDLAKTRQPGWPLARTGRTTFFEPVPFGTDQRGRTVTVTLMSASMIVGSVPRMGKTFSVRLLLLAAALDPLAELHLFELKGSGDLSALEPVAHAYRSGDDVDDVEYILADLRALGDELRRRMKVLRTLPKDLCPESKISPELAAKRSLGLHPVVVAFDECQRLFKHPQHTAPELQRAQHDLNRTYVWKATPTCSHAGEVRGHRACRCSGTPHCGYKPRYVQFNIGTGCRRSIAPAIGVRSRRLRAVQVERQLLGGVCLRSGRGADQVPAERAAVSGGQRLGLQEVRF